MAAPAVGNGVVGLYHGPHAGQTHQLKTIKYFLEPIVEGGAHDGPSVAVSMVRRYG